MFSLSDQLTMWMKRRTEQNLEDSVCLGTLKIFLHTSGMNTNPQTQRGEDDCENL